MAGQTPMMRQWAELKRSVPDAIVLFRLGDFYEAFNEDAEVLARVCDVTLTSRPVAKGARAPMAGVPYHAVDGYIAQLVRAGVKVAIVEQRGAESSPEKRARMSGPAREGNAAPAAGAGAKAILEREIVRVVTPGTLVEGELVEAGSGNYLAALVPPSGERAGAGLAALDLTTGEFMAADLVAGTGLRTALDELARLRPAELIVPAAWDEAERRALAERLGLLGLATVVMAAPSWTFDPETAERTLCEHFGTHGVGGFGLQPGAPATAAAGAALAYAAENQRARLDQVRALRTWSADDALVLDATTRRNLELSTTLRGERRGSLLWALDATRTALGARRLRRWLDRPLLDRARIAARHDAVEALAARPIERAAIRAALSGTPDVERLVNRVVAGYAGPRELAAMARGLEAMAEVAGALAASGPWPAALDAGFAPGVCPPLASRIRTALSDEPPAVAGVAGAIRPGYDEALDAIHAAVAGARAWIAALEARERERTGIRRLKVGYNRVFGYYLQVPKASAADVPEGWIRRQTVVDGERYVSPELKVREAEVQDAEERIAARERAILEALREGVVGVAGEILAGAAGLGRIDALASLAEVAAAHDYARPEMTDEPLLEVRGGRHPVVERRPGERFVPNDLAMAPGTIALLTGPNMAGKSTVGRQAALIVLMAQMGSFVPASSARIGLVDRVFTRIGAQDELAAGQSTFMVEMVETANLLHHATPRSLVILDELGRGTSTYDGIAIAWAVVEHLAAMVPHAPRTLFATHYHELTALAERLPGVVNLHLAVADEDGRIAFLHRVAPGPADRSYGVHVAELAGLPPAVTARAWAILRELEAEGAAPLQPAGDRPVGNGDGVEGGAPGSGGAGGAGQLSLFVPAPAAPPAPHPLVRELAEADIDALSPREALAWLYALAERAREAGE